MSKIPLGHFLIDTVEGVPGPFAVAMEDGRLVLANGPNERGAAPNVRLLMEFLRSREPIGPEVRDWLADLLDEGGSSTARLTLAWRRPGRQPDPTANWEAAEFVERLVEGGMKQEAAIATAKERFGLKSRSTVTEAIKSRRAAIAEHDELRNADFAEWADKQD